MRRLINIVICFCAFSLAHTGLSAGKAHALMSPHPISLYEKGMAKINAYHGRQSDLKDAEEIFAKLISDFPDWPFGYLGMSRSYIIEAYLYGDHYDMKKIRDLALPYAVQALEKGPSIREVHENYDLFEKVFDQFAANQKKAQEYLYSMPDSPKTFFAVANFIRDQGESKKALEYYKIALQLEPEDDLKLQILKRLGYTYLETEKAPEKAVVYYEEAMKLGKDKAILNEYLGLAYLRMEDYAKAIDHLVNSLNVVRMTGPEYYLLMARGFLAEREGRVEDAIQSLERASAYGREDIALHFRLGNLYYGQSKYENAYSHFKRVIDLGPTSPNAYYLAGRSADSIGEKGEAMNHYEKYLQLDAESEEADWIRHNVPAFSSH